MVALCCAFLADAAAQEATIAARILGEDIALERLGGNSDAIERARALAGIVYERAGNEYVRRQGLAATQAEIGELAAYDVQFRKHDREQRSRKLAELNARLGSTAMSPQERARAADFRDTLVRLERHDAQEDVESAPRDAGAPDKHYAAIVERWKFADSLYRRYGGTVGLTMSGPYPFGALARLCREFTAAGLITVYDADLERQLWRIIEAPPQLALAPADVDFIPYWKRPIPSSYMPSSK